VFPVQALGANTSYYIADQTILFQTVTSAFTTRPATTGLGLEITAAAASSFAVIQYVSPQLVKELLSQRMSIQIKCSKTGADLIGTVNLFYTIDNAAVPVLPLSLFTGITAGVPTLTTGWVKVPNTYPTQSFTVSTSSASTPFSFSGYDATAVSNILTAQNFAIAITFNTMTMGEVLTINYCSLVGGDIATRPAPQSPSVVLTDCQYYYQSSFPYGTTPAQAAGIGVSGLNAIVGSHGATMGISVIYPTRMRVVVTPALYSPVNASVNVYNYSSSTTWTDSVPANTTSFGFAVLGTSDAGAAAGQLLGVNFSSDARMGVA
jgi:hypothetical protein